MGPTENLFEISDPIQFAFVRVRSRRNGPLRGRNKTETFAAARYKSAADGVCFSQIVQSRPDNSRSLLLPHKANLFPNTGNDRTVYAAPNV